jgi:threonine aldolase
MKRPRPFIELRTDAFTQPTQEMIDVVTSLGYMYSDLARECPETEELESYCAELCGMEAGLLVPSGTMANLLGLMTQAPQGSEVVVEAEAHIYNRERGGIGSIAGLVPRPIVGHHGVLRPEDVAPLLRSGGGEATRVTDPRWQWNVLISRTSMVCIENAHNECGNRVWTPEQTRAICDLAHAAGARVHIDGARIFNAAVALEVPVRTLTEPADTVAIGIAKGLAAPVGALFCGTRETVERARAVRQMLGGAMHRPAWMSAAGLIALKKMPDQFRTDHRHARLLAEGLARIPGLRVDLEQVQTNTVLLEIVDPAWNAETLVARLAEEGVRIGARGERRCRLMTHHAIGEAEIQAAVERIAKALSGRPGRSA